MNPNPPDGAGKPEFKPPPRRSVATETMTTEDGRTLPESESPLAALQDDLEAAALFALAGHYDAGFEATVPTKDVEKETVRKLKARMGDSNQY